ncbi:hypothetical protein QFZ94_000739 [Paraburkholderia sp. JPY465]
MTPTVGYESPSARVLLLAAAHAALPKSDWCARFGVLGVTEDMLPRLRFEELFADNGGGRNGQTIRVYLKAWEGWIEAEDALAGDEIQDLHGLESLACCIRQDKHGCMRVRQTEANCNCEACVGRFCIEKTGDWP